MSSIPGNGQFSVRAAGRVIVLPICSYCKKVAPECRCGLSAAARREGR